MSTEQYKKEYAHLIAVAENDEKAIARLTEIMKVLRKECPWDSEQNHKSLRVCLIEEAYETAEAIDNGDMYNMEEELGDVMLQVIFHGVLGEEEGHFNLTSIINRECEKMIRRHPHVFSQETIKTVDKVLEKWENVKRKEKGQATQTERLSSVSRALPSLMRSYKIQARAAEVGFDWDDVSYAFQKIQEETSELLEAYQAENRDMMADELGDLLFSVVNVARFLGIDPEYALTLTSDKFLSRFSYMERKAHESQRALSEMTLGEMDLLWEEAKNALEEK